MKKSTSKAFLAGVCIALLASYATASGNGHDGHAMPGATGAMAGMHEEMERKLADTSAFGEKGDPAAATRTIRVEASEIKFDTASLEIGAGETVTFAVTNSGDQPHEFTIGDEAYQAAAREMMAMMADMGMDMTSPVHMAAHGETGNVLILQPGQTGTLTWRFTKEGAFLFSCNFVGHAEVGMTGIISVK